MLILVVNSWSKIIVLAIVWNKHPAIQVVKMTEMTAPIFLDIKNISKYLIHYGQATCPL